MKAIAFRRNLVMALIMLLVGAFVVPSASMSNIALADPLFYDDFENGTLDKWDIILGDWSVITEGSNHVAYLARASVGMRRMVSIETVPDNIVITAQTKSDAYGDLAADMAIGFYSNSGGTSFWEVNLGQGDGGNRLALVGWENLEVVASVINNDVRQYDNIWYNVKIMLCNNDIYARVWEVGESEPPAWQISYAGATPYGNHLLLGGIYGHQSEKFYFDDIIVFIRGDANGDGKIDIADVVYLINYLFLGGPPPMPLGAGDANCDGVVNIADVVYLVTYLFLEGPPPGC